MAEDRSKSLLELLINVSREVATALDLRTVLQRLLFAAMQYVGGERSSIVVLDDSGKPVDATIVYGKRFPRTYHPAAARDRGARTGGWVVQYRKPALVRIPARTTLAAPRGRCHQQERRKIRDLCAADARDRLVGVLTLVHPVPNTFNEQHWS